MDVAVGAVPWGAQRKDVIEPNLCLYQKSSRRKSSHSISLDNSSNNYFNFQHTDTFYLKIILNLQIQSTVYSKKLFSGVDFVQLPQYLNPEICA